MSSVRPPAVFTEDDLGSAGLAKLHELRQQRSRTAKEQITALVRYALYQAINGKDVELSQRQLTQLLSLVKLEAVA